MCVKNLGLVNIWFIIKINKLIKCGKNYMGLVKYYTFKVMIHKVNKLDKNLDKNITL